MHANQPCPALQFPKASATPPVLAASPGQTLLVKAKKERENMQKVRKRGNKETEEEY